MNYVVITPVRNEADRFAKTIASMVSQTCLPDAWVIVDDGSTDCTAALADEASRNYPWIKTVHRKDRGGRKQGGGVIEAFYDGFKLIENGSWHFVAKLDGDLAFESAYFERCLQRFQTDPKLGIGGGRVDCLVNSVAVEESPKDPQFHVRGAVKIYRRETWEAIGGVVKMAGWDTVDELKANMLGWKTATFKDVSVLQLKGTGSADGTWKNWVKNGRANYITGYHPAFMLAKCAKRSLQKPYGLAALGLFTGFFGGYFRRIPQISERTLIQYIRSQQINRLLGKQSLWSQ